MRIDQMRQIVEVYEAGSINKAAQKLFISQSSLSASLRAAEDELGQKILDRSHKGISLTSFGERFIETAERMLGLYDDLLDQPSDAEQARLFVSSQFLRYIGSVFASLHGEYENRITHFRFAEKTRGEVCQDVISRVSEIGFIVTPTNFHDQCMALMETSGLDYHLIATDESRCMVGRGSPLFDYPGDTIRKAQLRPFPIIQYERDGGLWEKNDADEDFEGKFPHSGTLVISDSGSFQNILARTNGFFVGICNLSAYALTGFYDSIRVFALEDGAFTYDTAWLRRKGQALSPMATEFLRRVYAAVGRPPEEILR